MVTFCWSKERTPKKDRVVLKISGVGSFIVAVPNAKEAAAIAVELVDKESVAPIELGGGPWDERCRSGD